MIFSCSLDIADVASLERFEPRGLSIVLGTVLDSPLPQIIVTGCVVTELAGFDLFASLEVLPRDRCHLVGSSHPSKRCTRLARLVDVRGESELEKRRDLVSNRKSVRQSSILIILLQVVLLVSGVEEPDSGQFHRTYMGEYLEPGKTHYSFVFPCKP